jgi:hypothetical protein
VTRSVYLRRQVGSFTVIVIVLIACGGAAFFVGRSLRANDGRAAAPPRFAIPTIRLPVASSLRQAPGFPSLAAH